MFYYRANVFLRYTQPIRCTETFSASQQGSMRVSETFKLGRLDPTETKLQPPVICNYCEHAVVECEPVPINASSFANTVSTGRFSFAINLSRDRRQMLARPVSNASRYI